MLLLLACTPKTPSDTTETQGEDTSGHTGDTNQETAESGETQETAESGETGETAETGGDTAPLPDDPRPLVLQVSGAYNGSLTFDEPSCAWYDGVPNFRAFWRNAAKDHVFVLVAEVLGPFEGPGTYDETMATTRVKLQEEAGGSGYYFGTDTSAGNTASITVEHLSETRAWGEFTFNGLTGEGSVTVTPQPVPIWCPELN